MMDTDNESEVGSVFSTSSSVVSSTTVDPEPPRRKSGRKTAKPSPKASAVPQGDPNRAKLRAVQKRTGSAQLPNELKRLRACMICSLIKTELQFEDEGCDNCDRFLHIAGTRGSYAGYTSTNFDGMIGMMQPKDSWVAKWQHLMHLKPGMYAVNVRGEVEKWVRVELHHAGINYASRDKSKPAPETGSDDESQAPSIPRNIRAVRRPRQGKEKAALAEVSAQRVEERNVIAVEDEVGQEDPEAMDESQNQMEESSGNGSIDNYANGSSQADETEEDTNTTCVKQELNSASEEQEEKTMPNPDDDATTTPLSPAYTEAQVKGELPDDEDRD